MAWHMACSLTVVKLIYLIDVLNILLSIGLFHLAAPNFKINITMLDVHIFWCIVTTGVYKHILVNLHLHASNNYY